MVISLTLTSVASYKDPFADPSPTHTQPRLLTYLKVLTWATALYTMFLWSRAGVWAG